MMTVNFDAAKLAQLRERYEQAVREGEEVFMFEGNEFLVRYVKHVLDYLEGGFE
jgi:hypothetical protein